MNKYFNYNDNNFDIIFYSILLKFGITTNKEFQFIYDDILNHLINDTKRLVEKNYNKNKKVSINTYSIEVFKRVFLSHFNSYKSHLTQPENTPECIRNLRIKKLNKLNETKNR